MVDIYSSRALPCEAIGNKRMSKTIEYFNKSESPDNFSTTYSSINIYFKLAKKVGEKFSRHLSGNLHIHEKCK